MKLSGRTFLITGGATGIGLGLAGALLARGNRVVVCGRRTEKLEEARRLHPRLVTHRCDVADSSDRERLHAALARDGMAIDVLVNNAACMRFYDFGDPAGVDMQTVREDVATNFVAPMEMIRLFLPMLRAQADPTIINVNSPGGVVAVAGFPVYCASKAAMISFSHSLRHQLRGAVRVITLYPPSVDTAMMDRVELDKVSVEESNREILKRLEGDDEEIWIGQARYIPVLARLVPKRIFRIVNEATRIR